jgi:protein DGCR14
MSLSQFLSTYTSDENVTLTEIIKKGDDSWYQKHSWMF